jgi:ribosomal protein L30/L7E
MWSIIIEGSRIAMSTDEAQTLRSLGLITTGSYSERLLTLTDPAHAGDVLDLLDADDSPLTPSERAGARFGTRPAAASTYQAA